MLKEGLYEQILNKSLSNYLAENKEKIVKLMPLDEEEAAKILAKYLSEVIRPVTSMNM